jgi:hypothetical protein
MTRDAAVVAVVISIMGGYYFARWRRAEGSHQTAKTAAETAERAAWRARGVMVLVALAVAAVIEMWLRGKGR